MITCSALVTRALGKLGVTAAGREPSADQSADGLASLQALYLELVGEGTFGRHCDVFTTDSEITAREWDRIVCSNEEGVTVTIPSTFTTSAAAPQFSNINFSNDYGFRGYAIGGQPLSTPRPPYDGAIVTVVDVASDFTRTYIYDSNIQRWTVIEELELSDDAPLSNRFREGLASRLAMMLAPEYARDVTKETATEAARLSATIGQRRDGVAKEIAVEWF